MTHYETSRKTAHRKSQIIGQTFVYIMGTIVFIVILIYGYSKISQLLDRQQQLCIEQMGADMRAKAEEVGQSFDVINYQLRTCGDYDQVCFWDYQLTKESGGSCDGATRATDPFRTAYFTVTGARSSLDSAKKPPIHIAEQIQRCQESTMAVFKTGDIQPKYFHIGRIEIGSRLGTEPIGVYPGFNCFHAPRGIVYLRLQGRGNMAVITADTDKYENPHAGGP